MLFRGVLGRRHRNQFHLPELVLAQHAPGIASRRSRLGSETRRECGVTQGKRVLVHDRFADQVREGHFRCGNEIAVVGGTEEIIGELGKVAGTVGGLGTHQQGRGDLDITKLPGVHIKHEGCQRPFKAGHGTGKDHETRTGKARRAVEIHTAQKGAEINVVPRIEGKVGEVSPAAHLDVVRFVGAFGNGIVNDIGDGLEHVAELSGILPFNRLQSRDLLLDAADFRDLVCCILAPAFRLADEACEIVAPLLQLLDTGPGVPHLAVHVEYQRRLRRQSTARAGRVKGLGMGANPRKIVHAGLPCHACRDGQRAGLKSVSS